MEAYAESLAGILKSYLSHIVYIDDEFKISWPVNDTETIKPPRRSSRRYSEHAVNQIETMNEQLSNNNLDVFCKAVRKEYPEILLTPVVYEEPIDMENLVLHMKNARLLVLDWSLSERVTAINLLKRAEFSGQLRFCVIYTSKLDDAKKEFIHEISNVKRDGLKSGLCNEKKFEYIRADSVIYMICEKDKFDFHMIMNALVDIFIQEIGFFPIAFLDMIARLEEKVPYYLNQFSYPFDKLLLLQVNSDGLPINDVYNNISDMVVNNIKSDIDLDENVLNGIYENQIKQLKNLLDDTELFEKRVNKSLDIICSRLECSADEIDIMRQISITDYRKVITAAIEKPQDLSKGIHNASEKMAKLYGLQKAEKLLSDSGMPNQNAGKVKKELAALYRVRFREKAEKIFPACLMILTNPEESYDVNKLVTSLKVVNYKNDEEKYFSNIFQGCYDNKDQYMCLKADKNGPRLGLLQNKLHTGDILFHKNNDFEKCYLCIVPSCHILRPKKVEGNILFAEGMIVSAKPDRNLKDSEHFTILPGIEDENQILRVVWQYHRIVNLDLKKVSMDDYENLYRPYRLTYEHIRQIMGEFVSFYSKSGVEELFLKADTALDYLLLRK